MPIPSIRMFTLPHEICIYTLYNGLKLTVRLKTTLKISLSQTVLRETFTRTEFT